MSAENKYCFTFIDKDDQNLKQLLENDKFMENYSHFSLDRNPITYYAVDGNSRTAYEIQGGKYVLLDSNIINVNGSPEPEVKPDEVLPEPDESVKAKFRFETPKSENDFTLL